MDIVSAGGNDVVADNFLGDFWLTHTNFRDIPIFMLSFFCDSTMRA